MGWQGLVKVFSAAVCVATRRLHRLAGPRDELPKPDKT